MVQADIEDHVAPPPLLVFRMCGAPGCRLHAREGGRDCAACHAGTTLRWRDRKRAQINARRRDGATARTDEQRARDIARATLAMALKRGRTARGCCTVCGSATVTAYQADPRRPLDVLWICRQDRKALIDRLERERRLAAENEAWRLRVERCNCELPLLPLDVQAAIRGAAARGPAGTLLSVEAPLYRMNVVRLFEQAATY